MMKQLKSKNPILSIMSSTIIKLPTPKNITYFWSFGSMLGIILLSQIITGVIWSTSYSVSMESSFLSTWLLMQTLDKMWLIRYLHLNGASLFFFFMYMHMFRGMFFMSFNYSHTWNMGVTILILSMATAFVGYVLPMNQMSFWAASVITNLFSEIPYIGKEVVTTIWGAPAVMKPTLSRFFSFHFLLPFILLVMVILHIVFIHSHTSSNPLGFNPNSKLNFHPNLLSKDLNGFILIFILIMSLIMVNPSLLMDSENFINANPLSTPLHIKPEWYFLFAYAILRCIPNKMGGVLALLMAVVIIYSMPTLHMKSLMKNSYFYPFNNVLISVFIANTIMLTWAGTKPVEETYIFPTQIMATTYFMFFFINPLIMILSDFIMLSPKVLEKNS